LPWVEGGVIQHNSFARPLDTKHNLKLHGPYFSTDRSSFAWGHYSEKVIISDNTFSGNEAGSSSCISVALAPENAESDQRVRDVIIERNYFIAKARTYLNLWLCGSDLTERNNIYNMSGGLSCRAVEVGPRGIEPIPQRVCSYNSTAFSNSTGTF